MQRLICSTLFIALFAIGATAALAQDPVKVDPNHYKVEFENDQVRVLRVKVGPHEKSIMHQHPNAVAIFLTDAKGKFNFPTGDPQDIISKAGEVRWTPSTVHLPENTGDQAFEVIVVELKAKSTARRTPRRSTPANAKGQLASRSGPEQNR